MVTDNELSQILIEWFKENKRRLPWRETRNPYYIWVSEVMLQQTQVSTVIPYYHRFIQLFPTVDALATAPTDRLMKAWEGLGYYARARNMQHAARTILSDFNGHLPRSHNELLRLKGFGDYTAASVSSIAFGEPYAAVDGNVIRVISRLFAIPDDVKKPKTREHIQKIADNMLLHDDPGTFNEAMMELGAVICTPKKPKCDTCPVQIYCEAYRKDKVDAYPYKSKRAPLPHYQIAIGVIHKDDQVLIALRPQDGLLGNLWEFPGGKINPGESLPDCCKREILEETGLVTEIGEKFAEVKHTYTHFKITLHAFHCTYRSGTAQPKTSQEIRWVSLPELRMYAFPKANNLVIEAMLNPKLSNTLQLF
ncbi:MAG: A/G-specific adenine glycosylase [Chlorobiales bacterium]|nr:A/G-specific adenine glycosylase [Chlorobiales bacterium]